MSDWFLQTLSVIPSGSWDDVARCFTMILWVRRLGRPSQGSVVFRHDDSTGHHIKTALDLSGATTQPADHNVQRNSALKGIRLNISHQSSSSCDLQVRRLGRPSQGSVVFRHDDSTGHHIKTALDLSGATTQPADHNVQRNSALKGIRLNIAPLSSQRSLKWKEITYQKLLKNRRTTVQQSRRHTNTSTTSRSSNPATPVSKLVSIECSREYELSATNLAPNGGVKRRQSTEIGFG
ncbi:protease Do-like 7 [Dorcoceras hygrometricum]|uniref:Protease Do-like 7 n=1 Tax=Dorcoceras hygrometricum TaxID=472368 RepID=A0A2Z7CEC6_9LAMI|nr:protease Do-like 7 [Dorcoceras hygrometricum]